jgi:Ca2+-binding EF-hand superfamily protein
MLEKDFRNRQMVATILKDPWFSMAADAEQMLDSSVLASLKQRQEKTGLKNALLADLASRENLAQMKELNKLFLQLDVNGDGAVSAEDVRASLEGKWPKVRIEELVQALLGGNNGEVSYEEFMGQLIAIQEPVENELLWRVFIEVDRHRKGYLDQDDIRALLERPAVAKVLGDREPAALMGQMSRHGTDKITFEDFKLTLQGHASSPWSTSGGLQRHFMFGPRMQPWQVDERAEYFSFVRGEWIPCRITAVDPSGAVQVDCKPRYWLYGIELFTRLRRPHTRCWLSWVNWACGGRPGSCGRA